MTGTRVVLADDQDLIRAGLRLMIDRAPGLTVVGEAATGGDAVRLAREARADVVLMDIRMPGLDGLPRPGGSWLTTAWPGCGC
jgi:YesN/AraC family two-component response regulator